MRVCINTIDDRWDNRVVALDSTWETFRDVVLEGHVVANDKSADHAADRTMNGWFRNSRKTSTTVP